MMPLFNIGELIIDTKLKEAVRVVGFIPHGPMALVDLYILMKESDDDHSIYINDDESLIVYDKYYFDEVQDWIK